MTRQVPALAGDTPARPNLHSHSKPIQVNVTTSPCHGYSAAVPPLYSMCASLAVRCGRLPPPPWSLRPCPTASGAGDCVWGALNWLVRVQLRVGGRRHIRMGGWFLTGVGAQARASPWWRAGGAVRTLSSRFRPPRYDYNTKDDWGAAKKRRRQLVVEDREPIPYGESPLATARRMIDLWYVYTVRGLAGTRWLLGLRLGAGMTTPLSIPAWIASCGNRRPCRSRTRI